MGRKTQKIFILHVQGGALELVSLIVVKGVNFSAPPCIEKKGFCKTLLQVTASQNELIAWNFRTGEKLCELTTLMDQKPHHISCPKTLKVKWPLACTSYFMQGRGNFWHSYSVRLFNMAEQRQSCQNVRYLIILGCFLV